MPSSRWGKVEAQLLTLGIGSILARLPPWRGTYGSCGLIHVVGGHTGGNWPCLGYWSGMCTWTICYLWFQILHHGRTDITPWENRYYTMGEKEWIHTFPYNLHRHDALNLNYFKRVVHLQVQCNIRVLIPIKQIWLTLNLCWWSVGLEKRYCTWWHVLNTVGTEYACVDKISGVSDSSQNKIYHIDLTQWTHQMSLVPQVDRRVVPEMEEGNSMEFCEIKHWCIWLLMT